MNDVTTTSEDKEDFSVTHELAMAAAVSIVGTAAAFGTMLAVGYVAGKLYDRRAKKAEKAE